jgi:hypothetical protein
MFFAGQKKFSRDQADLPQVSVPLDEAKSDLPHNHSSGNAF